jgi:hypothetical protein
MTTMHKILKPKPEDASPFYDHLEWEVEATKDCSVTTTTLIRSYECYCIEVGGFHTCERTIRSASRMQYP